MKIYHLKEKNRDDRALIKHTLIIELHSVVKIFNALRHDDKQLVNFLRVKNKFQLIN